ncbi:M13 family metallopeptidase [Gellertiella hungarica]|uniref:Putative metalloendopeptidase n=1 Tax=Gellertiella hungarica TaxID=1572859 RepID=A0A7W6NIB1_9HYPH|nr:M13 family metallopeptidase [Gellertiella hungarica]MBB4063185.1 putative metalloendopeptidase [Gellertiella hungarica]
MFARMSRAILMASAAFVVPTLAADPAIPPVGPNELSFSVENMDGAASPAKDFYRYASGKWQDGAVRPPDRASIGMFDFMSKRLAAQLRFVIDKAVEDAASAPKGSPAQQVGDFYRSYMDFAAIDAAGMKPLAAEFAAVDAIADNRGLSQYLGHYLKVTGAPVIAAVVPSQDQLDSQKIVLYAASGDLLLPYEQLYAQPAGSKLDLALRENLRDVLLAAGYAPAEAERQANLAADLEREFHAGQMTPVERTDPRTSYIPSTVADLRRELPELDMVDIARGTGITLTDRLIKHEPRYFRELSAILKRRPLQDFKDYLKIRLIAKFKPFLGTRFDASTQAQAKLVYGISAMPPRDEQAQSALQLNAGQPLSQLYVQTWFTAETRAKAADMVSRIRTAFLNRLKTRAWLTEETRKAAVDKLERLTFKIGYPDAWIDYSAVDIRPDDIVGNVMRLTAFDVERSIAKIGKPYEHEAFADPRHTLPIIINAAYDSLINGFEVPAAILQPAAFEPERDAAVNFCRIGAVIGHEMTHGFDSQGRLFDAAGNMRDWWTAKDADAFLKEAAKLVEQGNNFELKPGLKANGALNVTENMADVGGINFAYDALMDYLREHPEENVPIDGLTPQQRCFLSWSQLWATKQTDQSLADQVLSDPHAPNAYRAVAPLKHVDAFYEAFGIKPGDPEWLAPEKRVQAW